MSEATLVVRGVGTRRDGCAELDGLDLVVEAGEAVALLGADPEPTRCLFQLALGIRRPDTGTVRVAGRDPVQEPTPTLIHTGYLPPRADAPTWMRPQDYFQWIGLHFPDWDEELAEDYCEAWGVPIGMGFREMEPDHVLRVQLLATLAREPRLLLLERPVTHALSPDTPGPAPGGFRDPVYPEPVLATLRQYCAEGGALVFAGLDTAAVRGLATRQGTWTDGRLREGGDRDGR